MQIRWKATVWYRVSEKLGSRVEVIHDLEELYELHDRVEAGPHWDTIIKIDVERANHVDGATLTVEQAETI